ncbi:MAG: hypothetical protein HOE76_05460 [Euryarchaeota archaeon]|jgi:hypothetical protein|nr:hypothetical protein [Euryarchaeota archaeon]
MSLGLEVAFLPGIAIARRLDSDGDWKRHLMFTPAFGLLVCLGLSGLCFVLGWNLNSLTTLLVLANIIALISMRVELNPVYDVKIIQRSPWFWIFTLIACYIAIIPLTYGLPMGVDWVGFSALADSISRTGGFNLEDPSIGQWIYPPAFPMFAAWLGGAPQVAVFLLGTGCFVALLLGIAAIGDKMGCGHWTIMAMLMAPALFAKNLDSGYPTVASQLGLVVILTMFSSKLRWELVALTTLVVAMIHPTGLIYLTTLIAAKILADKGGTLTLADKVQSSILIASIIFAILIISPAFDGTAVFAEYGWQGGAPLAMYAGLLLPLGLWSAWTLRNDKTARVLILWLGINWVLSSIHLFDGLEGVTLLSMMSYALYSMSMHAFHIPLAVLVGMRLSRLEGGISSDGGRAAMIVTLLLCGVANSALVDLAQHDQLHVSSTGDATLFDMLDALPDDSIVYTENEHWGHIYSVPEHIGVTSVPTLGILKQEHSIQNAATTAIAYDDIARLQDLGITHALASPKGIMMQYIQASTHWEKMWSSGASTLYILQDDGLISDFQPVIGDNMRPDPWASQRNYDPFNLGKDRLYLTEGSHSFAVSEEGAYQICVMVEFVGNVDAEINGELYQGSGWYNACSYAGYGGIGISVLSDSEYWINPLGASGRGDLFIDQTGIRVHWIETISFA